jgi:hypothetical protein
VPFARSLGLDSRVWRAYESVVGWETANLKETNIQNCRIILFLELVVYYYERYLNSRANFGAAAAAAAESGPRTFKILSRDVCTLYKYKYLILCVSSSDN